MSTAEATQNSSHSTSQQKGSKSQTCTQQPALLQPGVACGVVQLSVELPQAPASPVITLMTTLL